ncbi:MAG: tripartite tricarboxylate transporter substrate binding protein [Hyphomicrobiales bacterium]|nr:tripartite tricarboxylate transporter substrate binding protein [Hyphomicrobiales bacterium]
MRLLLASVAFALIALSAPLTAQPAPPRDTWPAKPVRWINTAAPGSSGDIIARVVSDRLGAIWGQQVVIEGRPGAAGNIAAQAAARAAPDGYTYFFAVASTLAVNPYTFKTPGFDAERDFTPVVAIGTSPFMIAVNAGLPVRTLAELIALAKAQPGKLSYATSGSRNLQHIAMEMLERKAGIDLLNVPFRGSPFAAQETMAGRTEVYIDSVPAMAAHVGGDKLRVLAVTSATRLPGFDAIPPVADTVPGYAAAGWFALVAPAGTPQDVLAKVNADVNAVLAQPDAQELLRRNGVFNGGGSLAATERFMRAERAWWGEAVRSAGIEAE